MSSHNIERAKQVIESLIQGNDPATGKELPSDTVLNRIEVNRALLVAVAAIEEKSARSARRSQLPSGVGKPWSKEEEQTLSAEFKGREAITDIAEKHHRTVRAIEARLERLGLLTPDQRTTYTFPSPVASKKRKTTN
jgi:hypothetical protein